MFRIASGLAGPAFRRRRGMRFDRSAENKLFQSWAGLWPIPVSRRGFLGNQLRDDLPVRVVLSRGFDRRRSSGESLPISVEKGDSPLCEDCVVVTENM